MEEKKPKQYLTARRKYHVIYKTTCLVNGHYYIGMHSTDNLDDGYMGSGKKLWQSIKRHGVENHKCEIIEYLPTREALRIREAELVNVELITELDCMNIALGGSGGWEVWNASLSPEKRSELGKLGGFANRHLWSDETKQRVKQKLSETTTLAKLWGQNDQRLKEGREKAILVAASETSNAKRKATMQEHGHSQGEKNSQFGTCWIRNAEGARKIRKEELETYLSQGYIKGR